MTQPAYASAVNLRVSDEFKPQGNRKIVTDTNSIFATVSTWLTPNKTQANARLLAAAYNAFDSAAAKLKINAVECAERMADGSLAELVEALDYLLAQTVDMDLKHGITLTEGEEEARARGIAIIAKVKGGAI